jgi:hypothetical protein
VTESLDHHYVPRCLFRPWEDDNRKVWVYEKRGSRVLPPYRQSTKVICVERELYSYTDSVPEDRRNLIEKNFFSAVDGAAAKVIRKLIKLDSNLSAEESSAFATFIASLRVRTPEFFTAQSREGEEKFRRILSDKSKLKPEEIEALHGKTLLEIVEEKNPTLIPNYPKEIIINTLSGRLGERVFNAKWKVRRVNCNEFDFLLSDRPLVLANGENRGDFLFGLPISPKHVFFAANNENFLEKIDACTPEELVQKMNISVVQQAKRKAFAQSKAHKMRFFENRLGTQHYILPFAEITV